MGAVHGPRNLWRREERAMSEQLGMAGTSLEAKELDVGRGKELGSNAPELPVGGSHPLTKDLLSMVISNSEATAGSLQGLTGSG
jgi:hypothetical protein